MSLETNLKRKKWLRNYRFNVNFRTITLFIIVVISISLTIYGYHYTQNIIIEELGTLNEQNQSNRLIERFNRRREHIKHECSEFGLDEPSDDKLHSLNAWEFLINEQYGLVYCNIFKAASSSWLYNFNLLAGYTAEYLEKSSKTPVTLARNKYRRPSIKHLQEALDKYLSFLIVRHPFERLVSAYVDKFIKAENLYFDEIGKQIIKATRTQWRRLAATDTTRLPPELKNKINELGNVKNKLPPTFEEYIRFIICEVKAHHALNEHWTPMTPFCSPCLAHFDIIIKFETLEEDQNYLIKLAKLENIIEPKWKNPTNKEHKNISNEYFSQLSIEQIQKLVLIYQYDFKLFQYSPDAYFKYGQQNVTSLPCYSPNYKY